MSFGERLRALRLEKNFTLRELSKELDISFSALGKYERNEHQPDFETLEKIADYFNVSIDYLLGRNNNSVPYLEKLQETNVSNELNDRLAVFQNELKTSDQLTFNGEPMSEEAKESLLEAMEFALRLIQKQSKK